MNLMIRFMMAALVACTPGRATASERPNVVVVVADDLGCGDLSSGGNPHVRTPNLDRLRREGADLTRMLAAPYGAATRVELLGGKYAFRTGITHSAGGRNLIRPEPPSLPELLAAVGYRTALVGKWHLGENFPCRPEDRGFEHVFTIGGGGLGQTPDHWGNSNVDPWIRQRDGWAQHKGYASRVMVNEAKRWLAAQAVEAKPFFLYLAMTSPHAPYEAPADAVERMRKAGLAEPAASFHAMVEDMDTSVGDLLGELARLHLADRTVVVFLSDNGSAVGTWNAGMSGIKGSPDEGGVRVPAFIRWPGKIAPDLKITSLTSVRDGFETLVRVTGAQLPADWEPDGMDLTPTLLGEAGPLPERMFFTHAGHWPGDEAAERFRTQHFAAREGRWVLRGLELFDVAADPAQKHNVFDQHPDTAARMLTAYGNWWNNVRDGLARPMRYVIGDPHQAVVRLTASDWWPSREVEGAVGAEAYETQSAIRRTLAALAAGSTVPETTGHWKLRAAQEGNYQVRLSMLPSEAVVQERAKWGRLKPGKVHVRAGKREIRMEVSANATAVTLRLDLPAGDVDLEAWFDGQLPEHRMLGAFYAEIERVGERRLPDFKLDLKTEPKK